MNIFESLENLNVSEECFEDIVGLVEEYLSETLRTQGEQLEKKHREKYPDEMLQDIKDVINQNVANSKSVRRHHLKKPYDSDVDYWRLDRNVKAAIEDRENLKKMADTIHGQAFNKQILNPLTSNAQLKKERNRQNKEENLRRHNNGELFPKLSKVGQAKLRAIELQKELNKPSKEEQKDTELSKKAIKTFDSVERPHDKGTYSPYKHSKQEVQRAKQLNRNRTKGSYTYGDYEKDD